MPGIEDRTGTCKTCGGRAYRHPNLLNGVHDRWTHRDMKDWVHNPHEVDPVPNTPGDTAAAKWTADEMEDES